MRIENLIVDMDGVLWRGQTPMPGLPRFFEVVRQLDLGFVLATNNATKIAAQYSAKLAEFGVDVPQAQILTSAEATAGFLQGKYPAGTRAYVVGDEGLRTAMRRHDFEILDGEGFVPEDARAELVVVGFTRHACYEQLASAAYLIDHGARFIGTNPDVTFPAEIGPLPGAGSLQAFIQTATGQEPTIIGKPERPIFEEAVARLGGIPETTAMVGDRLETDITGAQRAGMLTILLLSGVTNEDDLAASDLQPDLVFDDLMSLSAYFLEEAREGSLAGTALHEKKADR